MNNTHGLLGLTRTVAGRYGHADGDAAPNLATYLNLDLALRPDLVP